MLMQTNESTETDKTPKPSKPLWKTVCLWLGVLVFVMGMVSFFSGFADNEFYKEVAQDNGIEVRTVSENGTQPSRAGGVVAMVIGACCIFVGRSKKSIFADTPDTDIPTGSSSVDVEVTLEGAKNFGGNLKS